MLLPIRRRNKKEIKKNQRDKKFSQGEGKKISAQAKKAYIHGGVDVAYVQGMRSASRADRFSLTLPL